MVRGVILAAGASSRMGQPKAALAIGRDRLTFLTRILTTLLEAGLPEVVVVTGATPEVARGAWPARDRRVRIVHNAHWQQGQLSSFLTALDAPSLVPIEAATMTLVDVPLVSAETVRGLLRAWRESRAPIVRPARPSTHGQSGEEHGHPVIFDAAVFEELRRADLGTGAKSVVRAHAGEIVNVPIDDPGAYLDIDTPEQYRAVRGS
jgi:molybdenum cofactor cytidylyltransferase